MGPGRRARVKLDHVAIAVENLEEAAKAYCSALGTSDVKYETVESEGVRLAIFRLEEGRLELMQPLSGDGPIADYLRKRGPGIHHVALQTPDVDAEAERMSGSGVRLIGGVRDGSEGTRIAFVHPKSLCGVLAELCSPPEHC